MNGLYRFIDDRQTAMVGELYLHLRAAPQALPEKLRSLTGWVSFEIGIYSASVLLRPCKTVERTDDWEGDTVAWQGQ